MIGEATRQAEVSEAAARDGTNAATIKPEMCSECAGSAVQQQARIYPTGKYFTRESCESIDVV
jgi:DnaJ-class molecular chaperone